MVYKPVFWFALLLLVAGGPAQAAEPAANPNEAGRGQNASFNACEHLPPLRGLAKGLEKKIRLMCAAGASSSGIAKGDFNGDGFGDLAIGIPNEDTPAGTTDSGAVIVIYGSANGLTTTSSTVPAAQFWSQNATGVPGPSQAGDHFGAALASGDFNGDGFSDLAVGVPGKNIVVGGVTFHHSGRVVIIYGSSAGLTTTNTAVPPARRFDFGILGSGHISGGEQLGSALAWGDFNGDGVGDLAMGAPHAPLTLPCLQLGLFVVNTTFSDSGKVWVVFGKKPGGLSTSGEQFLDEIRTGQLQPADVPCGSFFTGEHFGAALAAGDFNGDRITDLVVGVPDIGFGQNNNIAQAGEIALNFGSASGFGAFINGGPRVVLDGYGSASPPTAGDRYGSVLAAGDFNDDGVSDLAVGVPRKAVGSANPGAGAVHVRYGQFFFGLSETTPMQFWTQNLLFPGDPINRSEAGDGFGFALAAGDFNGDGSTDLAIGVPFEDVISFRTGVATDVGSAGEVDLVYGSVGGLSITRRAAQIWSQDTINILDIAEPGDCFGWSLIAWNFGRGSQADLAVGVPFEGVQKNFAPPGTIVTQAGAVNVIYGSPPGTTLDAANGLTSDGNQFWTAGSAGIPSADQAGANFGMALY